MKSAQPPVDAKSAPPPAGKQARPKRGAPTAAVAPAVQPTPKGKGRPSSKGAPPPVPVKAKGATAAKAVAKPLQAKVAAARKIGGIPLAKAVKTEAAAPTSSRAHPMTSHMAMVREALSSRNPRAALAALQAASAAGALGKAAAPKRARAASAPPKDGATDLPRDTTAKNIAKLFDPKAAAGTPASTASSPSAASQHHDVARSAPAAVVRRGKKRQNPMLRNYPAADGAAAGVDVKEETTMAKAEESRPIRPKLASLRRLNTPQAVLRVVSAAGDAAAAQPVAAGNAVPIDQQDTQPADLEGLHGEFLHTAADVEGVDADAEVVPLVVEAEALRAPEGGLLPHQPRPRRSLRNCRSPSCAAASSAALDETASCGSGTLRSRCRTPRSQACALHWRARGSNPQTSAPSPYRIARC